MKCVQPKYPNLHKEGNRIHRVSDERAAELVANSQFQYVPKHKWKEQNAKDAEVSE